MWFAANIVCSVKFLVSSIPPRHEECFGVSEVHFKGRWFQAEKITQHFEASKWDDTFDNMKVVRYVWTTEVP